MILHRWLFTNKEGFAVCKSGEWSSKKRKDVLKSFIARAFSGLGYCATLLLHGSDSLTRQQVKHKDMETALKGQMAGVCALQPLIRLKNKSSVFRNTYLLNRECLLSSVCVCISVVRSALQLIFTPHAAVLL